MTFIIKNSVINALDLKPAINISPFGLETADSSTFYSLEDGVGYRYGSYLIQDNYKDQSRKRIERVVARDGEWLIDLDEAVINSNTIMRKAKLTALKDSYLMDFVLRYRFPKAEFETATIARNTLNHKSTNIYHQFDVFKVKLVGEGRKVVINLDNFTCPDGFKPTMYVRDSKDEWVVHVRLFPVKWNKEIVKVCSAWAGTRSLPRFVSRILLSSDVFRANTWYRGEKKPYSNKIILKFFNLVSFGLVKLNEGDAVELETSLVISNE